MSFDAKHLAVLRRRAERIARRTSEDDGRVISALVCSFRVGREVFAIDARALREVLPAQPLTHLPDLPPWISGVIQLRSEILSVIDLGVWLQVEGRDTPSHLVILEGSRGALALAVEEVLGLRPLYEDELIDVAEAEAGGRPAVTRMSQDLVSILDPRILLKREDLVLE
ncbi:MAG: chemotaxis protein CheW [Deltaproteobacteria bacterium]|nr:chemotaxis protein CheW [Deltaproteobacteria bacterium]